MVGAQEKLVWKLQTIFHFKIKRKKIPGNKINFWDIFLIELEISVILHDFGRIDENGKLTKKMLPIHHEVFAKILNAFLDSLNFSGQISRRKMNGAILKHDYHSKEHTLAMQEPKLLIEKIVANSNKLNKVMPSSLYRTIDYNEKLENSFLNLDISMNERIS